MRAELNRIYLERDRRRRHLLALKNRYLAIIYSGCLTGKPVRRIHRELYDATIEKKKRYADKILLGMAIKLCNKAHKLPGEGDILALSLLDLFQKEKVLHKARKIINHDTQTEAEKRKNEALDSYIESNRHEKKWFYLASSHDDCAEDHVPYQGRLYVDADAPKMVTDYASMRGLLTMQWVIGKPAWFITRPNCRHYFVGLSLDEVQGKTLKHLRKKHKTHTKEGDREFQTPAHEAVKEYEDRLHMLRSLYREHPTEKLKREIDKTILLIKKWKKEL